MLLNYSYHANPTSHHDVLAKLKTFAEAQGWTTDYYYNESVQWGATGGSPPYGYISGSESAMGLYSNGYGSNNIIIRFRCEASGSLPQNEWYWATGIKPAAGRTLDTDSLTDPLNIAADYFTHPWYAKTSLSPGTMSAVWFFGDDKRIITVIAVDSSFVLFQYFGIPVLFDESDPGVYSCINPRSQNVNYYWYNAWSEVGGSAYQFPWERVVTGGGWVNTYDAAYANTDGLFRHGTSCNSDVELGSGVGYFNDCNYAIKLNSWTGKRTLIKPTVFLERQSDNIWYPMGTYPVYYLPFSGLGIGDVISYGAEDFMCFPNIYSTRLNGVGFRIA